jgi:hypothetical protein
LQLPQELLLRMLQVSMCATVCVRLRGS